MERFEIEKLRQLPIEAVAERLGIEVSRHKAIVLEIPMIVIQHQAPPGKKQNQTREEAPETNKPFSVK